MGTELPWGSRTKPVNFRNDPTKVIELVLVDWDAEMRIKKIGKVPEKRRSEGKKEKKEI